MPDAEHDFALAVGLHRSGRLDEAISEYRRVIAHNPAHVFAHANLGAALQAKGKPADAAACYGRAIALKPDYAEAHSNLGTALQRLGRLDEAVASYRQAICLKPDNAEAHCNLGVALDALARLDEAIESYRRAVALNPNYAEAHNNLGIALQVQGKLDEAVASFGRAIALKPDHAKAHNNLGIALRAQGRVEEAIVSHRRALALRPNYAEAHCNLAVALDAQGRLDGALESYHRALTIAPDSAEAHSNLGMTLQALGRLDEALASHNRALAIAPDNAEMHNNLGAALQLLGRLDEAIATYRLALAMKPSLAKAHCNLGMALLLLGDFAAGAAEYEWRLRAGVGPRLPGPEQPMWDGRPLPGGTILLRAEQGLGDAIQFVRYAPLVRARCDRVMLQCQPELVPLFATVAAVDQVIAEGESLPAFDVYAPLLSLMHILGTRPETIPAAVPYLAVDPARAARLRERMGEATGLKVGLVWAGNPTFKNDRDRSLASLSMLEPLLGVEEVTFFSLQKGGRESEVAALGLSDRIVDLATALDDFADTAAAISQLDLVISTCTSIPHLAGALGKPVWTMLAFAADWRWLLGREGSPWYPSMRCFRQPARGDWASVVARVADELRRLAASRERGEPARQSGDVASRRADQAADSAAADRAFSDAVALHQSGKLDEALAGYRRAIGLNPADAAAHNGLGTALQGLGRLDEAMESYRRALDLDPNYANAHNNVGTVHQTQDRLDEAVESYRRALALKPDYARAHSNLGVALETLGRLDEAMESYRRTITLEPDYAEAHKNLGAVLHAQGQLDEAIKSYRRAIELKRDFAWAHADLGKALLLLGDFAVGAAEYEWRWRMAGVASPAGLEQPMWDGRPLPGGTILLRTEQGLGDAIQFVRYAPLVRARCGRVLLQCRPRLARLFATVVGVDQVIAAGEPLPPFDAHAPLMSLMHILETRLETVPAAVPYLAADPTRVARLRERMGTAPGGKVGLVWAGNPDFKTDRDRSFRSLSMLEPLLGVERVTFFSLQKGGRESEIAALGLSDRIVDLAPTLNDFADTAAAISLLDLVISVDTAAVHLAGALGKPVWTMLSFAADWRWLVGREDSPWYPSMRLFRQPARGDWTSVIARVANELRQRSRDLAVSRERPDSRKEQPWPIPVARSAGATPRDQDIFIEAQRHHQRGRLAEAEAIYRRILEGNPDHVGALHYLGVGACQRGNYDLAEELIGRALALGPNYAEAHNSLGNVLKARNQIDRAQASYERALALRPNNAEAHSNLGAILQAQGRLEDAIACYRRALALKPDQADTLNNLGTALRGQGNIQEAVASYRRALDFEPDHVEALANLGTALLAQAKVHEAAASLRRALELKPDHAGAQSNLDLVLNARSDFDEAQACLRRAIALKPDHAGLHNNLGVVLKDQGKLSEAVACYERALALNPDYADAYNNLGAVLKEQEKLDEAVAHFERAIALNPNYAEAHSNLGTTLQAQGKLEEAVASYRRAIAVNPDYAEAHNNLGIALKEEEKLDEAAAHFERALALNPNYAQAHSNLGTVLQAQGKLEEAFASYRRAIALKPELTEAHSNLGAALQSLGKHEEAIKSYRRAIAVKPDSALAHHNLGLALLLQGNFATGAIEYEWRWRVKDGARLPNLEQPLWDGRPLPGGTILLRTEQGMGDAIHFVRYAPLVRAHCGRVVVKCPPALAWLFTTVPGVDHVIGGDGPLPAFDAHAPLLSLMRILETRLETIPAAVPYLKVDPARLAKLRDRIGEAAGLKVGVVWAGNPTFKNDRNRSMPLSALVPLLEMEGVAFFSLQKGERAGDIAALGLSERIIDLAAVLEDFADTAAAISLLDLVISVDTAAAHLAGALGEPVWTLLPFAPDWRWLVGREDSPWYPTMRLFRQPARGDWSSVIARVADELRQLVASRERGELAAQSSDAASRPAASAVDLAAADRAFADAVALHQSGKLDEAAAHYRRAIALNPWHASAHNNLGATLQLQGRLDDAAASYARALRAKPDYAEAHSNLGATLQARGKLNEAIESYRRALALRPDNAVAHGNLGAALYALGRLDEALASYHSALAIAPDNAEVHNGLGVTLQAQGRLDEAIESFKLALALRPDHAGARYNLGMALLLKGDITAGASEYEWRWRAGAGPRLAVLAQPIWDGRALPDATILLRAEQGLGDAIQFVRYARLVRTRCGRVLLQCQPELAPLFATAAGVDEIIVDGQPLPAFDAHAPLLSLMHLLKTRMETIPAGAPYLAADPARVAVLRERMGEPGAVKVGLAWAGSPDHKSDRSRSLNLSALAPLLGIEGAAFFSLQKGAREGEIEALGLSGRIVDLAPALDDFADSAAAISLLDLVISVDTAAAHLAGALGKPVWTLVPFAPDWRWLVGREDSPWYPSMRLFRQPARGDWPSVIARVAEELRYRAQHAPALAAGAR